MTIEKAFGPIHFLPAANCGRYPNSNSIYVEGAGVLIDAGADSNRYRQLRNGPGIRELWFFTGMRTTSPTSTNWMAYRFFSRLWSGNR